MEPKLEISPDFTIEDIRKIRDYSYEMTKNMSSEEMIAYIKKGADRFKKELSDFKTRNTNETKA